MTDYLTATGLEVSFGGLRALRDCSFTVDQGRITRVSDAKTKPTIDLSGLTVMPGWIDVHIHPTWYFNKENRLEQAGPRAKSTPQQQTLFRCKRASTRLRAL